MVSDWFGRSDTYYLSERRAKGKTRMVMDLNRKIVFRSVVLIRCQDNIFFLLDQNNFYQQIPETSIFALSRRCQNRSLHYYQNVNLSVCFHLQSLFLDHHFAPDLDHDQHCQVRERCNNLKQKILRFTFGRTWLE